MDYSKLYFFLFNAITDSLSFLKMGYPEQAKQKLIQAQQQVEEMYTLAED